MGAEVQHTDRAFRRNEKWLLSLAGEIQILPGGAG